MKFANVMKVTILTLLFVSSMAMAADRLVVGEMWTNTR